MVGERSLPGDDGRDVFHCLNCGSVVAGVLRADATAGPEAAAVRGAIAALAATRATSSVDQFVIRQNIAIYERQLAREADAGRRALLLDLLDRERAKQAPADTATRTPRP
jgi:hypothetical protein